MFMRNVEAIMMQYVCYYTKMYAVPVVITAELNESGAV
jgi:hypothetical protein